MIDEARIDALYALPLDRFVAERDAYAAELRAAGERSDADAVRALAKPSVPAWAVNQLARHHAEALASLAAIGDRLRSAQSELLSGGAATAVHEARAAEREAVAELLRAAELRLAEAGFAPNAQRAERIADTLGAMAADEGARATILAGRLTAELQRVGFTGAEVATPAPGSAVARGAEQGPSLDEARAHATRAIAEAERAREEAGAAAVEADRAEAAARAARAKANEARRRAERAERAAADAVEQLKRLES